MLRKMLIQGLIAAAVIGAAAAVYAQAKGDSGDPAPARAVSAPSAAGPGAPASHGYLQPGHDFVRKDGDRRKDKHRDRDDRRKPHRDSKDDD